MNGGNNYQAATVGRAALHMTISDAHLICNAARNNDSMSVKRLAQHQRRNVIGNVSCQHVAHNQ